MLKDLGRLRHLWIYILILSLAETYFGLHFMSTCNCWERFKGKIARAFCCLACMSVQLSHGYNEEVWLPFMPMPSGRLLSLWWVALTLLLFVCFLDLYFSCLFGIYNQKMLSRCVSAYRGACAMTKWPWVPATGLPSWQHRQNLNWQEEGRAGPAALPSSSDSVCRAPGPQ